MTYEFKFSPEFLNLIVAGLAKLPFEQSAQAIQAIQREVQEQDAKAKKPVDVGAHNHGGEQPAATTTAEVAAPEKPKRKYTPRKPKNGAAEQTPAQ